MGIFSRKTDAHPPVNTYHEQPPGELTPAERAQSIKGGRKFLAAAEKAADEGDMETAQTLRRLVGD